MYRRQKLIYSEIEIDWLKQNKDKLPIQQLAQRLSKSINSIKNKINELEGKAPPSKKKSGQFKRGFRKDLFVSVRSGWEADVLRWLNFNNKKWLYEPKVFYFKPIKHGTISYLPDIYNVTDDIYIEIKGFLTSQSRTALKRMKQYYPEEFKRIKAIPGSPNTKAAKFFNEIGIEIIAYFNDLKKQYKDLIANWET